MSSVGLEIITVVFAWHAVLTPVPPERVLPLDADATLISAPWDTFEVSTWHGDVVCAELGGRTECAMARFEAGEQDSGLVVSVPRGARLAVYSCSEGLRTAVLQQRTSFPPPDSYKRQLYYLRARRGPTEYCWWNALCEIIGPRQLVVTRRER